MSKFAGKYFPVELAKNKNYQNKNYELALKETFIRIDECLLSHTGKRILFNNLKKKEEKLPYEFPDNVNFDTEVTLDPTNPIDKAIIRENAYIEKHDKLPDYFSQMDEDEEPVKPNLLDLVNKKASLSLTDVGGCTACVGLIKDGKI